MGVFYAYIYLYIYVECTWLELEGFGLPIVGGTESALKSKTNGEERERVERKVGLEPPLWTWS